MDQEAEISWIWFLGTSDSLSPCHHGFHHDLFVVINAGTVRLDNPPLP